MLDAKVDSRLAQWVRSLFGSMSLGLFLWLFAAILLAFAAYAFVSIRTTSAQWNLSVLEGARQFSDLIKRSTHYGMLLNRKEDVHQIIRTIAAEPGVVGVRIYDKHGFIIYSAEESEIGGRVDMRAEACWICHDTAEPLRSVPGGSTERVLAGNGQGRVLGLISPIENAPECSNAGCHAHPSSQTVLGVLDVKMSLAAADERLATTRRQLIVAGILTALAVGVVSALFIDRVVRRPVRRLMASTAAVSAGDLTVEIPVDRRDEMGRLGHAFNRMTRDLRQARAELTGWSDRLERRLVEKTEELGQTQRQVVHMEKMASLGKLSATVAHELNNPLAGILNYARLVERSLSDSTLDATERDELLRYVVLVRKEASRCGDIVRNLLLFARRSGAHVAPAHLNEIIDRALMLIRHHLEMADVTLESRSIEGDDSIVCDADQIEQALVALCVNAVEAMPHGGQLAVRARREAQLLAIEVSDTGGGIPPDDLPLIFEPFFSTKDQATGVGLGLAVVYGIVQRHGGEINVDSRADRGTTFRITLPSSPPAGAAPRPADLTMVAGEVCDGQLET